MDILDQELKSCEKKALQHAMKAESSSRGVIRKEESLYLLERSRGTMEIF